MISRPGPTAPALWPAPKRDLDLIRLPRSLALRGIVATGIGVLALISGFK